MKLKKIFGSPSYNITILNHGYVTSHKRIHQIYFIHSRTQVEGSRVKVVNLPL